MMTLQEFYSEFNLKIRKPYLKGGEHFAPWDDYLCHHLHMLSTEALQYVAENWNSDEHRWLERTIYTAKYELADRILLG